MLYCYLDYSLIPNVLKGKLIKKLNLSHTDILTIKLISDYPCVSLFTARKKYLHNFISKFYFWGYEHELTLQNNITTEKCRSFQKRPKKLHASQIKVLTRKIAIWVNEMKKKIIFSVNSYKAVVKTILFTIASINLNLKSLQGKLCCK